jgi:MYXO-CTERM domain-containing protein
MYSSPASFIQVHVHSVLTVSRPKCLTWEIRIEGDQIMRNAALAAIILAAGSSAAMATTTFIYQGANPGQNPAAGTLSNVKALYETGTDRFEFRFDSTANAGKNADGFWLAVSGGPNPKGHSGELALIYVDAINRKGAIYAYNGENGDNSYLDGTSRPGIQTPDFIRSLDASNISMNVTATGVRQLFLSFDATTVQQHLPLDPIDRARNEWTGVAFGNRFGMWFHPVSGLNATFGADGRLTNWSYATQGWIDFADQPTIPTPGAAAVLGLAALTAGRRRR